LVRYGDPFGAYQCEKFPGKQFKFTGAQKDKKRKVMINKKKLIIILYFATFVCVTAATVRKGGDEFKNLKVLPKNITADSLNGIMESYEHALGVKCGFCHVMRDKNGLEDYASDSMPHKESARNMMRMTMDINKKYFPSGTKYIETVDCNTCHRGQQEPPEAGKR
jgi:hypothetical protein